jgi:hypothetical protein
MLLLQYFQNLSSLFQIVLQLYQVGLEKINDFCRQLNDGSSEIFRKLKFNIEEEGVPN